MKKVIRLTESQLENIIRKVIAEQENYPISDGHRKAADELLRKGPKPTGSGEKYCFTKDFLTQGIANSGYVNVSGHPTRFLHKIGEGDTFNKFQNKSDSDLQKLNPLCKDLKGEGNFRKGYIIQYTTGPFSN
jgi:hypothetical protein